MCCMDISNYTPHFSVGCDYLSIRHIAGFGTQLHIYAEWSYIPQATSDIDSVVEGPFHGILGIGRNREVD